jgi:hypothetical protein
MTDWVLFVVLEGHGHRRFWKILSFTVGGAVALCVGLLTSVYLATLHENDLWFSNIKVCGVSDHCVSLSSLSQCESHSWVTRTALCCQ